MKQALLFLVCVFLAGCSNDPVKTDLNHIENELKRGHGFTLKNESGWDQAIFLEAYSPYKEIFSNLALSDRSLSKIHKDLGEYESGHVYLIKDREVIGEYFGHRFLVRPGYALIVRANSKDVKVDLRDGVLELSQ